ncbi:unnamed protein product [Absidia cylindrospora]
MDNVNNNIATPPQIHERGKVRRPTMISTFTSSTSSNSLDKAKIQNKDPQDQRHLRSYGRTDIIRQKTGFLGWTLARWLLLLANTMLLIYGAVFLAATSATYANSKIL